jgi:hypothetical protein
MIKQTDLNFKLAVGEILKYMFIILYHLNTQGDNHASFTENQSRFNSAGNLRLLQSINAHSLPAARTGKA